MGPKATEAITAVWAKWAVQIPKERRKEFMEDIALMLSEAGKEAMDQLHEAFKNVLQ